MNLCCLLKTKLHFILGKHTKKKHYGNISQVNNYYIVYDPVFLNRIY